MPDTVLVAARFTLPASSCNTMQSRRGRAFHTVQKWQEAAVMTWSLQADLGEESVGLRC